MPEKKGQASTQQIVLPAELEQSIKMKDNFIGMVCERYGYVVGRKTKVAEMNEATKGESKAAKEAREAASKAVETLIKTPNAANSQTVKDRREDIKTAADKLKSARKPFMEKISILGKAIRFCDSIAIPDAFKQLGVELKPRVELSKWCNEALEATKKK